MDRVADIAGGIITVALVTTIVSHRNTARVITALGGAFTDSLGAAMGRRR